MSFSFQENHPWRGTDIWVVACYSTEQLKNLLVFKLWIIFVLFRCILVHRTAYWLKIWWPMLAFIFLVCSVFLIFSFIIKKMYKQLSLSEHVCACRSNLNVFYIWLVLAFVPLCKLFDYVVFTFVWAIFLVWCL